MKDGVRFTLRLVDELNDMLEREAMEKGLTKHALLVQILWEYITRKGRERRT